MRWRLWWRRDRPLFIVITDAPFNEGNMGDDVLILAPDQKTIYVNEGPGTTLCCAKGRAYS